MNLEVRLVISFGTLTGVAVIVLIVMNIVQYQKQKVVKTEESFQRKDKIL